MKYLFLLFFIPTISFAETLTLALYENHEDYLRHSRTYRLNWHILKKAVEIEDIKLNATPYVWVRAIRLLERNRIDAIIGAYYSQERAEFSIYSKPFSIGKVYLYSHFPSEKASHEIDKASTIVGVTDKAIGDELAVELGYQQIYRKSSSEEVFDLVLKNKLNYAIFPESVANKHCYLHLKNTAQEQCIYALEPAVKADSLHAIYAKTPRLEIIAQRIDLAVDQLITRGEIETLFKAFNFTHEEYQEWLTKRNVWPL